MSLPRIACLILAAGRSRRFGPRNKLLTGIDGQPLLWHALDAAAGSQARPLIVVTGHQRAKILQSLRQWRRVHRYGGALHETTSRDHRLGMAESIKAGLAKLPDGVDGAIVCLGDMPRLRPQLLDRLIAAWQPGDDAVVPVAGERRGNPVLLSRALIERARRELSGDEGARRLLMRSPRLRRIEVEEAALLDVDTRRDARRMPRRRPVRSLRKNGR